MNLIGERETAKYMGARPNRIGPKIIKPSQAECLCVSVRVCVKSIAFTPKREFLYIFFLWRGCTVLKQVPNSLPLDFLQVYQSNPLFFFHWFTEMVWRTQVECLQLQGCTQLHLTLMCSAIQKEALRTPVKIKAGTPMGEAGVCRQYLFHGFIVHSELDCSWLGPCPEILTAEIRSSMTIPPKKTHKQASKLMQHSLKGRQVFNGQVKECVTQSVGCIHNLFRIFCRLSCHFRMRRWTSLGEESQPLE